MAKARGRILRKPRNFFPPPPPPAVRERASLPVFWRRAKPSLCIWSVGLSTTEWGQKLFFRETGDGTCFVYY
jgi:hypothetical protein